MRITAQKTKPLIAHKILADSAIKGRIGEIPLERNFTRFAVFWVSI